MGPDTSVLDEAENPHESGAPFRNASAGFPLSDALAAALLAVSGYFFFFEQNPWAFLPAFLAFAFAFHPRRSERRPDAPHVPF